MGKRSYSQNFKAREKSSVDEVEELVIGQLENQ